MSGRDKTKLANKQTNKTKVVVLQSGVPPAACVFLQGRVWDGRLSNPRVTQQRTHDKATDKAGRKGHAGTMHDHERFDLVQAFVGISRDAPSTAGSNKLPC